MNKKRFAILSAVFALVVTAAFSPLLVTTMTVTRFGPFFNSQVAFDSLTGGQPGGQVRVAINGETTDTLNVGEIVYWSDTNKVSKSATLSDYNKIAGVVVGGYLFSGRASISLADTSSRAAPPGRQTIVLMQGRTWVLNDANGTIAIGGRVIPSDATQGRVETITTAIDTNYRTVGKAVIGAPAGKAILLDVNIR